MEKLDKLHTNRGRLRDFTLIELLIVISIIAILAGMLLPALNKARDMAKKIHCVSNQKSCGTAVIMYASDYKDWHPLAYVGDDFYTNWEYRNVINHFAGWAIGQYTGYNYINANSQNAPKVMFCSAADTDKTSFFLYAGKKAYRGNYLFHPSLGVLHSSFPWTDTANRESYGGRRLGSAKYPARHGIMWDADTKTDAGGNGWLGLACDEPWPGTDMNTKAAFRHNRYGNVLYADGHSASMRCTIKNSEEQKYTFAWNSNTKLWPY